MGAPFVDYLRDEGLLVIGYIDGTTYDNDSFQDIDNVTRAGRAIRQLHDGPRFTGDFDMFTRQAGYVRIVHERGFRLPDGYEDHDDAFQRVKQALAVQALPRPCRATTTCSPRTSSTTARRCGSSTTSTPATTTPASSSATPAPSATSGPSRSRRWCPPTSARPPAPAWRRVRLQALVSAYGWSLWGVIQANASHLDFDFDSWALEHYEKAVKGFTSRRFDVLLEEVASA